MATLFTLTFQGQVEIQGAANGDEEQEISRQAFPLTLPRDAAVREGFRAWKVAPLTSGRLLVSVVANRGDKDSYGRPVLSARGTLLAEEELAGPARDLSAVWSVLEGERVVEHATLLHQVELLSTQCAEEAFAQVQRELTQAGPFFARFAGALRDAKEVDLYLGHADQTPKLLQPAFALLPLSVLKGLHLAIGSEVSEYREPILGLAGSAPEAEKKGFLGGLFKKDSQDGGVVVDFPRQEVREGETEGPQGLVRAIADPQPWPDGLHGIERYRVLLSRLDAADGGRPKTLFETRPGLEELRQAIRRLEALDKELEQWR